MKNLFYSNKIDKNILLVFIILLIGGLSIVKDYGVSSDEYSSRIKGFVTLNYLGQKISPDLTNELKKDKNIPDLESYEQKIYGVVFEAPASFLEVILKLDDKKFQFLLRHYLNFIVFFISSIFFYKILFFRFDNKWVAFIGTLFLILSPRIFANSFYNNKDLVFMSFFIIASYYAIKFIELPNYKNSLIFSIFAALAIDVRVLGIIIPIIVLFINTLKSIKESNFKKNILLNTSNIIFVFIFVTIFWPYLWESPINNFIFAFKGMANFEIETFNLFFGDVINAKKVPWNFIPLWIIITTPILYVILYLLGTIILCSQIIKNRISKLDNKNFIDLFFILTIFGPLTAVIIFNSTLYNGWRQMYFIYPSILFISTISILYFYKLKNIFIKYTIFVIIFLYLFNILFWILKNHPHQYVYFNEFVKRKYVNKQFDLDYWGLSYKENLEFLLNYDKRDKIKIYNLSHNKLFYSLFSIDKKSRNRFIVVDKIENAEYVLTNFYMQNDNFDFEKNKNHKIINEVLVDKFSINTVYEKIN